MMSLSETIWAVVKILIMVGFLFNVGGLLTWLDRRQSAMIQDRIGPNRAVIKVFGIEFRLGGLLHPLADGVKFFFKEDFIPPRGDKLLFAVAPILVMAPVLALIAVIPFGDKLCVDDLWRTTDTGSLLFPAVPRYGSCLIPVARGGIAAIDLQVASLNVGILYVFALAGQGIVGAALAGWSSDNKFSLLGALRAASQMVSYEVTIGMSLVGALMIYGSVRMGDMVRWQGDHAWGIFIQPLAFFMFFMAAVAESKRIPFDLPEAESELVSGYFTEYSGMKFGMFYFAEYMEVVTSSMLLVTIFLGGWQLPFLHRDGLTIDIGTWRALQLPMNHLTVTAIQVCTFFGKVLFLCWIQCFVRWSLPRFRYDQLMKLCWRILLPLSLANILVTGVVYLLLDHAGPVLGNTLQMIGDLTQAVVAIAITYFVLSIVIGLIRPTRRTSWVVGSTAKLAQRFGGTPRSPRMQA